jgi:hypothetical protein
MQFELEASISETASKGFCALVRGKLRIYFVINLVLMRDFEVFKSQCGRTLSRRVTYRKILSVPSLTRWSCVKDGAPCELMGVGMHFGPYRIDSK